MYALLSYVPSIAGGMTPRCHGRGDRRACPRPRGVPPASHTQHASTVHCRLALGWHGGYARCERDAQPRLRGRPRGHGRQCAHAPRPGLARLRVRTVRACRHLYLRGGHTPRALGRTGSDSHGEGPAQREGSPRAIDTRRTQCVAHPDSTTADHSAPPARHPPSPDDGQ